MITLLLGSYLAVSAATFVFLMWLLSTPMMGPVTVGKVIRWAAAALVWPALPWPQLLEEL